MIVNARAYHALQIHDLDTLGDINYPTREWSLNAGTSLSSLISVNGWTALRAEKTTLNIFHVPEEDPQDQFQLLDESLIPPPSEADAFPQTQYDAVRNPWAAPRWSPVEPVVAFAGAIEDSWVNVYFYDARSGKTKRAIKIEKHTLPLSWSPDGRHLVMVSGDRFQRQTYRPTSLTIYHHDDPTSSREIPYPSKYPLTPLGWLSNQKLILASQRPDQRMTHLVLLDLGTSSIHSLASYPFRDAAVSASEQRVLLSGPSEAPDQPALLFDLDPEGDADPQPLAMDGEPGAARWLPALQAFALESQAGTAVINPDGSLRRRFPEERGLPFPSPDGQWVAFGPGEAFYDTDFHLYSGDGNLVLQDDTAARHILWWPDSKGLLFSMTGGKIALADPGNGKVKEVSHTNGWELSLVDAQNMPFSWLFEDIQPLPSPQPLPTQEPVQETPEAPFESPLGSGTALNIDEIHMQGPDRGWALGRGPEDHFQRVLYTTDAGKTWSDVTPPKSQAPPEDYLIARSYGVLQRARFHALDENHAWVTYAAPASLNKVTIWRTSDAGQTWQPGKPVDVTALHEYGPWVSGYLPVEMYFIDQDHGWLLAVTEVPGSMMAADTVLLRTEDGGQAWDFILGSATTGPQGLIFLNRWQGWMLQTSGQPDLSRVLHTEDGGEFWFEAPSLPVGPPTDPLTEDTTCTGGYEMEALPEKVIKLILRCPDSGGEKGQADPFKNLLTFSDDSGLTWQTRQLPLGTEPGTTFSTEFMNERVGWLLDFKTGELRQTIDAGQTWRTLTEVSWKGKLHFFDHLHGWAVPGDTDREESDPPPPLFHTTDGGTNWESLNPVSK